MKHLFLLFPVIFFFSCSKQPQNINYGSDQCAYCSMTIVDQKHAAEIVTTKGKVYKFDAIECMIDYKNSGEIEAYKIDNYYVNYFENDGHLLPVQECFFLISPKIPSPMGANLTAFKSRANNWIIQNGLEPQLEHWEIIESKQFNLKNH